MNEELAVMEQEQDQKLATNSSSLGIVNTGENPILDGTAKDKINAIREFMLIMEKTDEDKSAVEIVRDTAANVGKEFTSSPDQNMHGKGEYEDKKQDDMSLFGKIKDVGRSFGALYGNRDPQQRPAKSQAQGEQQQNSTNKPDRGHFARSMEITRSQFIDSDPKYKGVTGFFRKSMIGLKSLVGAEIKDSEPRKNYKFNNNLMLSEAELVQKNVDGKRMFHVTAANKTAMLHFSNISLLAGRALGVSNSTFLYRYNISDNKVEEQSLQLSDFIIDMGMISFEIIEPIVDFNKYQENSLSLRVEKTSIQLHFPENPIATNIKGTAEKLELSVNGLTWGSASASVEKITIGNVLTFSNVEFNLNKDIESGEVAKKASVAAMNLDMQAFGGKEINFNVQNVGLDMTNADNWILSADSIGLTVDSGELGELKLSALTASLGDDRVDVGQVDFGVTINNDVINDLRITGQANDVSWSSAGGMDYSSAEGTIANEVGFAGFKLAAGTSLKIEKNDNSMKTITIQSGLALTGGALQASISNAKVVLTEIASDEWDYEVSGIDEEKAMTAAARIKTDDFGLDVAVSGINLSSKLNQESGKRDLKASVDKLSTSLSMLGITSTGEFNGIRYQDEEWKFDKVTFSLADAKIKDYFSIKQGSLSIVVDNQPKTDAKEGEVATKEKSKKKYSFALAIDKAQVSLGAVNFSLDNLKGTAKKTAGTEATLEQGAIPDGWLLGIESMSAKLETGTSAQATVLEGLGMSVDVNKLVIDTGQKTGSVDSLNFSGNVFQKNVKGNVKNVSWNESGYEIGRWEAEIEQIKLGSVVELGKSKFIMEEEKGVVKQELEFVDTGFKIPGPGDSAISGGAKKLNYQFDTKRFSAEESLLKLLIVGNSLEVGVPELSFSEEEGIVYNELSIQVVTDTFSFLDGNLVLSQLKFNMVKTPKGVQKIGLGGSLAVSANASKVKLDFNANGTYVEKDMNSTGITGKIDELTVGIASIKAGAKNVAFTDHSFECIFSVKPEFDESFSVADLLDPVDLGLFALKKLCSKAMGKIVPEKMVYDKEAGFRFEKVPRKDFEKVELPFFDGHLNVGEPDASTLKLNAKYPKKFTPSNEQEAAESAFSLTILQVPLFDVGFFYISLNVDGGLGLAFTSDVFIPKLEDSEGMPKLKFGGPLHLGYIGFGELILRAQLGRGIGAAAEAFARVSAFQSDGPSSADITMEKGEGEEAFKFVGSESSLKLSINTDIIASLGLKLKVVLFGKDKTLKEFKFVEKKFGTVIGAYKFAFGKGEGNDDDKLVTKLDPLHFVKNEGLDGIDKDLVASSLPYNEALEQSDLVLLDSENKDNEVPRNELITRAKKAKKTIEAEVIKNRTQSFLVQKDFGEYSTKNASKIEKFRDMVKKHEYRIKNEVNFQKGLKEWNPALQIIPTYSYFDTSTMGNIKKFTAKATELGKKITAAGEAFKKEEYTQLLGHVSDFYTLVKEYSEDERPPEVLIAPGNIVNEMKFYKTLLGSKGEDIYLEQDKLMLETYNAGKSEEEQITRDKTGIFGFGDYKNEKSVMTSANTGQLQQAMVSGLSEILRHPKNGVKALSYIELLISKGAMDRNKLVGVAGAVLQRQEYIKMMMIGKDAHMLDSSVLEGIYSSHSVKEAQKKIDDEIEELINEIKGKEKKKNAPVISQETKQVRSLLLSNMQQTNEKTQQTEIKDPDKDSVNRIKEMLTHSFVQKHAQSRISFYNDKMGEIEIKTITYQKNIKILSERFELLQKRETALHTILSKKNELIVGNQSTLDEWRTLDKEIKGEQSVVGDTKLQPVNAETKNEKDRVDKVLVDLEKVNEQIDKEEAESAAAAVAEGVGR